MLGSNQLKNVTTTTPPVLQLTHVRRNYQANQVLKDVNLTVQPGEFVAIMGESGAGKSTLLNVIATIDQADGGVIELCGKDISRLSADAAARLRREKIGFVFQHFNLLENFTNQDNILLPLVLNKVKPKQLKARLAALVQQLALADLLLRYPYEISGGQQQRVAVARALITQPDILLADEPTGALDSRNTERLLALFRQINQVNQQTILMVTHSAQAASYAQRTVFIKDGVIYHQLYRGDQSQNQYMKAIADSLTVLTQRGDDA